VDKSAEQLKKIKNRTTEKEVRGMMGNPDKIEVQPLNDLEYNFLYGYPIGYSGNFRIFFYKKG
jgi:hypothetical protein